MDCREIVVKVEYDEEDIYTMVYVALINKKEASTVLEMFCEDIPLQNYGLNHLKRIQPLDRNDKSGPLQIIVCPVKSFDEVPIHVRDICKEKRAIKVAKLAPACRPEFEAWNKCWPINFHASHLEKQREKGLSNEDMDQVNMACQILSKEEETIASAAVIVNPENGKNVTCSSEAMVSLHKRLHAKNNIDTCSICSTTGSMKEVIIYQDRDAYSALYTATMMVIEGVAAVVRGDVPERGNILIIICSPFSLTFYYFYIFWRCLYRGFTATKRISL